jgi:DNA polymerase III subunit alpha
VFVPLHVYTNYTFLSSGFTLDRLFSSLKEKNYNVCAITDLHVLYGLPEFFTLAKKNSVTPLAGIDIRLDDLLVTFFAKDEFGYRYLIELSHQIQQKKPIAFKEKNDHLIAVISPFQSSLFDREFDIIARRVFDLLGGIQELYIGIEHYANQTLNQRYRQFAAEYNYQTVAFPHLLYPKSSDAIIIDILQAIQQGTTIQHKEKNGPHALFDQQEFKDLYTEDEIIQTTLIANALSFNFFVKRGQLLTYDSESNPNDILREMTIEGLQIRDVDFSDSRYLIRLDEELNIIESLGFSDYFLIVSDFIKYAKHQAIPVGPGRGSGPGSLVAYALAITEIDPIRHGLLFERFLNPSRKSMPDIDVDIADLDRQKIVDYLINKYGSDRVCHIITYQTIQAKQAVRDIGRIYQFSSTSVELLSKSMSDPKLDLRGNYKKNPAFQNLFDQDSECAEIIKLAHKIEGFIRQSGVHPAGLIFNQGPMHEVAPLVYAQGMAVSQYEFGYLEAQGFLKIDILGLRNLTIIQQTLHSLTKHGININLNTINYDDPRVFQMLNLGLNMGLFQLESEGMKKAMMLIQPTQFNDIVSLIALYRPGPMENIPNYARRKHGTEPITIFDVQLNDILAPTYGIIIYQEQIMQIAQKMAGFSLSKADDFRRVISKKDSDAMKNLKESFLHGAVSQGFKSDHALSVFNHIVKFADYGFNKSHSVAYATITYQMAYLKTYYPLYFYQSLLKFTSSNDSKFLAYFDELRQLKIKILSPNITQPYRHFTIVNESFVAPLTMIKGITDATLQIVQKVLQSGPFIDFYDAVTRLYPYKITIAQLTALIDGGAFLSLHPSRATLRASLPNAIKNASIQATFIDESTGLIPPTDLPKMPMIAAVDNHQYNVEKELEVLGFVFSSSILGPSSEKLGLTTLLSIKDIKGTSALASSGGLIQSIKQVKTKTGQAMAFLVLFDETDTIECVVFPKLFTTLVNPLQKGDIVVVSGHLDKEKKGTLLLEHIQVVSS